MATVLEKPILLDETGQDIVSKLEEIKSAITTSGDFTPVQIKITTPPTKRTYASGEELDLTGMVITLIASNGITYDVTASCTTNPVEGTAITGDTDVVISFYWAKDNITFTATQKVFIKVLQSIAITTPPAYTDFYIGQQLELDGIAITANYKGGITEDVTDKCVFNPAIGTRLTVDDTEIIISYTEGSVTKTTTQEIRIVPVYGAEWDGTASSSWTRTDGAAEFEDPNPYYEGMESTPSSPFDDIMPWSGMVEVEDEEAGNLVAIPKFWYKWTRDGAKMKLQISSEPESGFLVSPAHADRGDGKGERDVVYVGSNLCTEDNYKSTAGRYPQVSKTISEFRTGIHNLGSTIWQWDYAMYWTICMLYLVEFADWDSQSKIGLGGNPKDVMTRLRYYHTGTSASLTDDSGHVFYRQIANLWDSMSQVFCDGIYSVLKNTSDTNEGRNIYCIKNPSDFGDTTKGVLVSNISKNAGGTIESYSNNDSITSFEYALIPKASDGKIQTTTYICDQLDHSYVSENQTHNVCVGGGIYSSGSIIEMIGLFRFVDTWKASTSSAYMGSRLMKLP